MFSLFSKKSEPSPAPRIHVIEPKPPAINIKRETLGKFRKGMWIVLGDRVGILTELNELGIATVMLVDEHGFNVMQMNCQLGDLRPARISEIPAGRVAHLDKPTLKRFGYEE